MFDKVRADITRKLTMYSKEQTLSNKTLLLMQQGTGAVIVYRFGNWLYNMKVPLVKQLLLLVYFFLHMIVMVSTGINIRLNAEIGKGFVIHNFSSIFIGAVTIGDNCTVNQGVSIGNIRGSAHKPIIGNNVYFGAGSKVLGAITIGNNVVIGANSSVITSIPDNCTVMGVPAKIISRDAKSAYLKYGDL
jgi:serine O-acetyltransferase